MAVYFSSLEAGLRAAGMEPLRVPVPYAAVGGVRRQATRVGVFARAAGRVITARPDVVHCVTGSQPNLIGNVLPLVAARITRRPSVLSIAGGEFPSAVRSYTGARRRLVRFILSRPRLVIACTAEIAEAVRALGIPEARVVTVTNALPARLDPRGDLGLPPEVAPFADAHSPLIASISGWYDFYGSQDLVEAVRRLRADLPHIGLVLMVKGGGDPDFRARLLADVHAGGLDDAVMVREDERAVLGVMRRADAVVRTPHREGDAISVREALAVGAPVVASDVGLRPAGVVRYKPADPGDLTSRLGEVLATGRRRGVSAEGEREGESNLAFLIDAYGRLANGG
jgi:glycosyltransferase involved in cell wall biosynthesis